MQRRLASLGLCVAVVLGATLLLRAVADNFDPAEKTCAQNLARFGIAIAMYLNDYDDVFPMAYERPAPTQAWRWNELAPVPRDWQSGAPREAWVWVNSLEPYLGSVYYRYRPTRLSCSATLPVKQPGVDYSQRVRSPFPVSYTYNGYLHRYRLASIEDFTTLPVIWEGLGREHLIGFAPVNPLLRCDRPDQAGKDCFFRPCENPADHYPRGEVRLPRQSVWIHRTGMHFLYLDGRVQPRRLGRRLAPNQTDPLQDPFTLYNAQGIPSAAHTDACGYLPLFAPQ